MQPKISVITPVFNAKLTLEKMIQSVIEQDYPHVELIIMDGGSTDGTLDIIKKYQHFIAYWRSEKDNNAAIALNAGIKKASGDLITFLMADDFYEAGIFKKIAERYAKCPVDILTCGGQMIQYDHHQKSYQVKMSYQTEEKLALNIKNISLGVSAICCRFIAKPFLERVGLWQIADSAGKHLYSADKEFLLRAMFLKPTHTLVSDIGHYYVAHPGSSTFSRNRTVTVRLYEEHMGFAMQFLKNTQLSLSNADKNDLMYWYCHQAARLALYRIMRGSFKTAFIMIKHDFKKFRLRWLTCFMLAPFQFLMGF